MNKIPQIQKNYALLLLPLLFLSSAFNAYSQNAYRGKSSDRCETFGTPFGVSQQSMSTTMQPGQKTFYNIVIFKDFLYRFSLCVNNSVGGLYFRILSDDHTKRVLFDSSDEGVKKQEMILDIDFSCNLIIEVVYPKQEQETKRNKSKAASIRVLIEYYRKD